MAVPDDRRYTEDHQWIRQLGDGRSAEAHAPSTHHRVGLTDFAQEALGEVTLVRLLEGAKVAAGDEMGEVEAFKAMTDLYMPVSASIVEVNAALSDDPELVNRDPYGDGWLCTVDVDDPQDLDRLLDGDRYRALIGEPS